jgi:hypothetical protein
MDLVKELSEMDLARLTALIRDLADIRDMDEIERDQKLSNPIKLLFNRAVGELASRARTFEQ